MWQDTAMDTGMWHVAQRVRERGEEAHTHYAICLCHKHIKSAIKRIGSQMRHEKRYDKMEKRETVNGEGEGEGQRQRQTGLERNCHKMSNKQAMLLGALCHPLPASQSPPSLLPACLQACPDAFFNFYLVRF